MKRALLAVALALLFAACSGGGSPSGPTATPAVVPEDGAITITASEWQFAPASIAAQQGQEVRIQFQNDGRILHDLTIADLDADVIESISSGPLSAGEGELFVGAEAGDRGTLVFVPRQAGTFTYYCSLDGHRALGMEGTLTVR